jgi:16S rRNA (adenine1518-N6/adenine1519-N6)-dimethyltransferase
MKNYLERVKKFNASDKIKTEYDQCFLIDESILDEIIRVAKINSKDRVLEVGPGLGFLTEKLADRGGEVLAIEIDKRFEPFLSKMPKNVKIIYGDAYKLINQPIFQKSTEPPTKIVSNIPYTRAQNMLHNYTNWSWYQGDLVWLAPLSLAKKVNEEPILGAYFKAEVIKKVPKGCFYPQPETTSAIIYFHRVTDPKITKNFEIYLRRWFYNHEEIKVKNMLREGLIKAAYDLKNIRLTKNEARKIISDLNLPKEELEKLTNNIKPEYYFEIPKKLENWFNKL